MTAAAPGLALRMSRLMREDRGRMLAALIASLRDVDLAEEALSEAVESALVHWARSGLPQSPQAWLIQVARRKAIDRLRRQTRFRDREAHLVMLAEECAAEGGSAPEIPDERLRLIFTCCHPALDAKSRVALTLRLLGGLTTAEIARAFLDSEVAMGQRLSRAKARIAAAGIPFAVPEAEALPERLAPVLDVIYLIFNEGYSVTRGEAQVRADLCEEAIFLARMVLGLMADDGEVAGLLSLMLTTHARRAARTTRDGALVALTDQDRALWDDDMIAEGLALIDHPRPGAPGPFRLKAELAALHVRPGPTDWARIVRLFDRLLEVEHTPVIRLNRAVALAETGALAAGLAELGAIAGELSGYQPYFAALAELSARAGDRAGAKRAYARAITLSGTGSERDFLTSRLSAID
jgi:RNA polymerase sigma-70 factor (ECF subfamily)